MHLCIDARIHPCIRPGMYLRIYVCMYVAYDLVIYTSVSIYLPTHNWLCFRKPDSYGQAGEQQEHSTSSQSTVKDSRLGNSVF